jgi:hypothetical protein
MRFHAHAHAHTHSSVILRGTDIFPFIKVLLHGKICLSSYLTHLYPKPQAWIPVTYVHHSVNEHDISLHVFLSFIHFFLILSSSPLKQLLTVSYSWNFLIYDKCVHLRYILKITFQSQIIEQKINDTESEDFPLYSSFFFVCFLVK